jgi:small conductance mechanosensitive channel
MSPTFLQQVPTPSASSSVPPDCLKASDLCSFVFRHWHNSLLASSSYYVIIKPIRILLIVVIALVIRYLLHRAINKLIRRTAQVGFTKTTVLPKAVGALPASLQPAPRKPAEAPLPERRRQRAEAIGSILLSFATAAVFSIAGLMVLAELGIQLAPLLASAGIAGLALGFGAQTLVKDLLAGLFMLIEDQYGVGDAVDVGEATGVVESVGMRITSIRDSRGVLWHVRNGEIVRVGNKSQGWALIIMDVPVGYTRVDDATRVLEDAGAAFAADDIWGPDLIEPPAVLGVERVTVDGAVLRVTVKTTQEAQGPVGRELRTRLTAALAEAGIMDAMSAGRVYVRPPSEDEPPAGTGNQPPAQRPM